MVEGRTTRRFTPAPDFEEVLATWASEKGYRLRAQDSKRRTFRKGNGFALAPMMLEVVHEGETARIDAWVNGRAWQQLWGLLLTPPEMVLDSGGLTGAAPRRVGRATVNALFKRLSLQPIT
ncbi:MAG: hypothetical protein OXG37_07480 [Actinomycetia bacterium]|nr:hypothetical protein [Actinomycetes bacterium]